MPLSNEERGAINENDIIFLVKYVRENVGGDVEESFAELRAYLDYHIKLFSRQYRIAGCDSDEIEQESLYALRYKAIEDFDPERGRFRSFAILCIKRHLFSLIKGNNQQKRRVLNDSQSLNEDRISEDGENVSLINIIAEKGLTTSEIVEEEEDVEFKYKKLLERLSRLEQAVFLLYRQRYSYEEMVDRLREIFPERAVGKKKISLKTIDNALVRLKSKAQNLAETFDWD